MDSPFICCNCEKSIPVGEPMWSVNHCHEVFEEEAMTVLYADIVYVYCIECAEQKDFRNIIVPNKVKGLEEANQGS
jgi:hypothetical protein